MIQKIVVCGAGTMGRGIVQVTAQSGFSTVLYELNEDVLKNAKAATEANLNTLVKKNKITVEQKERILERIQYTSNIQDCIADVIIEAIVEKPEIKIALFNQLAVINHTDSVFATNTSSLPVSSIAAGVISPQRVIGMHFFNPAPVMKLVEVVTTNSTGPEIIQQIVTLVKSMGKTPVICKDAPGFIVNRVARPYYIESLRLVEENLADYPKIDLLMEASGFKMGPFKLMDLIGNDVNYAVSCSVHDQLGKPARLQPSFIQKEKTEKGELGRKSGKGYYSYS
jgi:3-hydroxybutyryl-CoA dehydrogenase